MPHTTAPFICLLIAMLVPQACATSQPSGKTPVVKPVVVRTIPHDTSFFTQGLLYYQGSLYESTGLLGQSLIAEIDPLSGTVRRKKPVPGIFGEGLCVYHGQLVQLTWRAQRAGVFDVRSLDAIGEFTYRGEGWGLATDNSLFMMSNGSDTITFRNKNFEPLLYLRVTLDRRPLTRLNELEYANGVLYANVWYDTNIYQINPSTGAVARIIDCSDLMTKAGALREEQVLNGIACNDATGTFFVTGKKWPVMFEIRIP